MINYIVVGVDFVVLVLCLVALGALIPALVGHIRGIKIHRNYHKVKTDNLKTYMNYLVLKRKESFNSRAINTYTNIITFSVMYFSSLGDDFNEDNN